MIVGIEGFRRKRSLTFTVSLMTSGNTAQLLRGSQLFVVGTPWRSWIGLEKTAMRLADLIRIESPSSRACFIVAARKFRVRMKRIAIAI